MQQGRSGMANSVETLGVDSRTRAKQVGAKEKSRRKSCEVRLSLIRNKNCSDNYMRTGVRKPLRTGLVPARAG